MADEPPAGAEVAKPPALPGWVRIFGIIGLVLLLVVIVVLIVGGGEHGPWRHAMWMPRS